ncbi:CD109 antigen [Channa argus]|uniref:CD109 antigen n=1 Tax=Channa argus TaxID=215402 RepID=UPI003521C6FE
MDGIWTLLMHLGLCFAVPGLTQDSSRTLFLISGPVELHAGTPTLLSVIVIADSPGRVTAELVQGNIRVTQTLNFQRGLTTVLTLPPIPGSVAQDSLFNLTVRGYSNNGLIFTNTTTLGVNLKNISTLIQTDRSCYQPGDTVRIRIVSVQLDKHPYKGIVEVSVQDPGGNIVDRQESTGILGIVLLEFNLSQTSPLGLWAITTTVNGVTEKKTFTVDHYEHLPFVVLVKTTSQVLVGHDISGSVRALYPSGKPVLATLTVSVTRAPDNNNAASSVILKQTKEIYGSTQFFFSKDQLQPLYSSLGNSSNGHFNVAVSVTQNSTGYNVNKTVVVQLRQKIFQLKFKDFPTTLKPSLYFSTKLRISRYDRKPLASGDLMHSAVVEVTQRPSTLNSSTTLTLQVPEDGKVHIKFKLRDQIETVFIRARFQSSEETLTVYNNYSSPSGSYIQISPSNTLYGQIGFPVHINVESTFQPTALHFVVSSRGEVVDTGTKNSLSFSLTPSLSWSPESCITVYCILSNGEVTSDTARIFINHSNYVSLSWSSNEAQPGEQVSLSVTMPEPRSQVGIVIMGMDDETLEDDQDLQVEQHCSLKTLTNAGLYKENQPDGAKNGFSKTQNKETYWSHWMNFNDSLLWLDTNVSDAKWMSGKITVPDGVTSLRAVALVMSDNLGLGFTQVPQKLTVSKDFSLSLNVPSYLIRGEEIVLEVNIINHLEQELEVIVLLTQNKAFKFVLENRENVSVKHAQKLNLRSHVSGSALFPIRPVALGEIEITVDAVSAEASDRLVWRVLVKPGGVEQFFSKTMFLELEMEKHSNSVSISFSFPPNLVPGSQRAHAALVGDILGLSINNLESLVEMPLGCGEQNMIHIAPSIYVLQYLDKSTLDNQEIRTWALNFMREGYVKQLSYQRDDGSFSAFGASDTSGSTWLTAFVLRCFIQAQNYIQVDENVLTGAMTWLLKRQGPQGEFSEVGRLIHTEMQGGLDNGPVALTAYVLIALLEDGTYVGTYQGNVSLALSYLESKVSSGVVSNYSLCLVTYALTLANSPLAEFALAELNRRADHRDGEMMWRSSAGLESNEWDVHSAQIEMVSYVLLVLFRRGSLVEGIALLKWLSNQRNHLGGYTTTQDTVVALQALAYYAAFSGANAIDLRLNITSPGSNLVSLFSINSTTYRMYQRQEINADKDLDVNIYMEGRGFAMFQMNVFYNLESRAFSQNHNTDKETFALNVSVVDKGNHDQMMLSVCTSLKDNKGIPYTGMVILDVGMLSGFSLSPSAAAPTELIRKVEILPEKVILYLDSLEKSEVCIDFPVIRNYKVARVEDAVVQVYDYYEPMRRATRTYNLDVLRNMDSCSFCGENCDRCRPGIAIVSSHSTNSATYSLSFLFLGISAFFIVV